MKFAQTNIKTVFLVIVSFAVLSFFIPQLANAATFEMNPASKTFERGCKRMVDIEIDPEGQFSNAAEIEISYDVTKIQIEDSDLNTSGTQIKTGNAYQVYNFNNVDTSNGIIKLAGFSFSPLNTKKVFGTIEFTSLIAADNTVFDIKFDGVGQTNDSNIASSITNDDLLTDTTNGVYSFIAGPCEADTESPKVIFNSPSANQTNVSATSNVSVRITDSQSGLLLNSIQFIINGETYSVNSPSVSYTGSSQDYSFTIDPISNFLNSTANTLIARGEDNAGNKFNQQIVFSTQSTNGSTPVTSNQNKPPVVVFKKPQNLDSSQVLREVEIELIDEGNGIDEESVEIIINGEVYKLADDEVSLDISENIFRIILNLRGIIDPIQISYIKVTGLDNLGNRFDEQIVFNLPTSPLYISCENVPQAPNQPRPICINQSNRDNNQNLFFQNDNFTSDIENAVGFFGIFAIGFGALYLLLSSIKYILSGSLFTYFLDNKDNKLRGIVYNEIKGNFVANANIIIKNTKGKIIDSVVSDQKGRYRTIDLDPGEYIFEVKSTHFATYNTNINVNNNKEFYFDIPLIPIDQSVNRSTQRLINSKLIRFSDLLHNLIYIAGLVFSIFASYFIPNIFNFALLGIFLFFPALILFYVLFRKPGNIKLVNDDAFEIPNTIVKVFRRNDHIELIDVNVTNNNGMAKLNFDKGEYLFSIFSKKYEIKSDKIYKTAKGLGTAAPSFKEIGVNSSRQIVELLITYRV